MSAAETKKLLQEFNLTPNKALGQNFLCDDGAVNTILDAAGIDGENVLEIGPGLGAITLPLSRRAKNLAAVEIDAAMYRVLQERLKDVQNTLLLHGDFLKFDLCTLPGAFFQEGFHVAANLPYYVTTPICMALLSGDFPIRSMTLMLQKEAAERFFAAPSSRVYGPLSVLSQYGYAPKKVFSLSPTSYYPEPEVDSVVIRLKKKEAAPFLEALPPLLHAAFAMRRKTLFNNLKPLFESREALLHTLEACNIDQSTRAEALSPADFARLAAHMEQSAAR